MGVHGYVDYHDVPEDRSFYGAIVKDERFFAKDVVEFYGQIIGVVYAETAAIARTASRLVHIEYEDLPAVLTISDAIEAGSFHTFKNQVKRGTPPIDAFKDCDHVFEGVSKMGGQEHFYLETNTSLVNPKPEDGEMEVWSSTQNIMETQTFVSQITGVPNSRIVVKVKRLGGGFGGKESRSVQLACVIAVAAKKSGRPMRCMLTRDEDMLVICPVTASIRILLLICAGLQLVSEIPSKPTGRSVSPRTACFKSLMQTSTTMLDSRLI